MALTYAVVTPARNEAALLPQLAGALRRQTLAPTQWVIVENGSHDSTVEVAQEIAAETSWAQLAVLRDDRPRERGAPIVQAFRAGVERLHRPPDIVAMVDADITVEPDYFAQVLSEFEVDPALGIASGSLWEFDGTSWRQRFNTGGSVWGGTRLYRWECLQDVLPLEERVGWDGVDEFRARARGWRTRTLTHVPFHHHRVEGHHDRSQWSLWKANGETAHFLGYRIWYLLARTFHQARRDRAALGLLWGYASAAARRRPKLDDPYARAIVRRDQQFRNAVRRRREAVGSASPLGEPAPAGEGRYREPTSARAHRHPEPHRDTGVDRRGP